MFLDFVSELRSKQIAYERTNCTTNCQVRDQQLVVPFETATSRKTVIGDDVE